MGQDDDNGQGQDSEAGQEQVQQDDERINVARLCARDPAEWARAVRLASPNIRGAVRSFATDEADPDDLVQKCWIRVVNQIGKFSNLDPDGTASRSAFTGWVVVVSLNHCKDLYRGKKRTSETGTVPMEGLDEVLDGGPNPEELYLQRQLQKAVWEALATLPEREREAIMLKHGEGRSTAEIAAALRVSPASVRRLVHRATYKLHKKEELREWLTR